MDIFHEFVLTSARLIFLSSISSSQKDASLLPPRTMWSYHIEVIAILVILVWMRLASCLPDYFLFPHITRCFSVFLVVKHGNMTEPWPVELGNIVSCIWACLRKLAVHPCKFSLPSLSDLMQRV